MSPDRDPSAERRQVLLATLQTRFDAHRERHPGLAWADVSARFEVLSVKLGPLERMEATGGEPDVIGRDDATGEIVVVDCAPQSPVGRRSLCFDPEALAGRKKIFCDRRYGAVFVYHNGADSYYGARGFRGLLRV